MNIVKNKESITKFPYLHASSFQHPHDVAATKALESVPLLPTVLSWMIGNSVEVMMRQRYLSNSLRIDKKNGGYIYEAFEHAAAVLDLKAMPEIFIQNSPIFNAYAMGTERPQIVLTSSLIDAFSEDEILGVVGHELGHIKCNHMLNKTFCNLINTIGLAVLTEMIPGVGMAAEVAIKYAMANWSRKAELSCDRAALLVTQNPDIVKSMTMVLASGTRKVLPHISDESIQAQLNDYSEVGENTLLGKLMIIEELEYTHPIPIVRYGEISKWAKSQDYQDILAGKYTKEIETEGTKKLTTVTIDEPVGLECPKCSTIQSSGNFCKKCSTSLTRAKTLCTGCLSPVSESSAFCGSCGKNLSV